MTWPYAHLEFVLDACCVNARGRIAELNELDMWRERDVIELNWPEAAHAEALRADRSGHRARKVAGHLVALTYADNAEEKALLRRIQDLVFPGGVRDENERNDVLNLFVAQKYIQRLITLDGTSRKARSPLACRAALHALGIEVVTPAEALDLLHTQLRRLAKLESDRAARERRQVAEWVHEYGAVERPRAPDSL